MGLIPRAITGITTRGRGCTTTSGPEKHDTRAKNIKNAIFLALFIAYPAFALAPPPINFSKKRVKVDGRNFIVKWDGKKMDIREDDDKGILEFLEPMLRNWDKDIISPNDDQPWDWGCSVGCLIVVVWAILIYGSIGFAIWRFFWK